MPQTVAQDMAEENLTSVEGRASRWLPDSELAVYVDEFGRNSFQGGLNYYRIATSAGYE
jgi:microsomal epoxide hydrolase